MAAGHANDEEERQALLKQAQMIEQGSQEALPEASDRYDVNQSFQMVQKILDTEADDS